MKFKLLKKILLSQLLIWCCDSTLYAQDDSINSDSVNTIQNTNCKSDSNHNEAFDISEQSNTKKDEEANICWIPMNDIMLTLCLLSTLFSLIALCISFKKGRNNNENYQKWVDSCKRNPNNISELEERVISVEKQMRRLEDLIMSGNRIQTIYASNVNNNDNNDNKKTQQAQQSDYSKSITKGKEKPEIKIYEWLKVVDGGRLALVESPESAYYRAWTNSNGITYFEFYCSRPGKAINNRTSLIEPFCEIQKGDVDPDSAKRIVIIKQGILNNDYSIISKVVIQYN